MAATIDQDAFNAMSLLCIPRQAGPLAAALLTALLPGGCAAALGAGAIAATGKTPIDHLYSLATGKDCSLVRKQHGLTYCAEDQPEIALAVHCYPTLGEATCYRTTDPYPGSQRELGGTPPPAHAAPPAAVPAKAN